MELPEVIYSALAYSAGEPEVGLFDTNIPIGFPDESDYMVELSTLGDTDEEKMHGLEEFRAKLQAAFSLILDPCVIVFDFELENDLAADEEETYDIDVIEDNESE